MSDDRMARTQPAATDALENADANGEQTEQGLRGDESVVTARRAEGTANSRARAAVQAALDKIQKLSRKMQEYAAILHCRRWYEQRDLCMPRG